MISLEQFRRAIQQLDGQRIETQHRRQGFVVRIFEEGPEYIPESSGEPRPDTWNSIQRVLERFNATGSVSPKDYHDLTYHSSYILAILNRLVDSGEAPSPESARPGGVASLQSKGPAARNPKTPVSGNGHDENAGRGTDLLANPHQRVGSVSNAHVGADFEVVAQKYFERQGIRLQRNFPIELGLAQKKVRLFDLGASDPKTLVECKSHKWTAGGRVPSAKMTVWNEAMYYFHLAPDDYRKVLFVLHDRREKAGETLLSYYMRMYAHLVPDDVEFLEWDEKTGEIVRI